MHQSDRVITKIQMAGAESRTFRIGDAVQGAQDFLITAGVPFLTETDGSSFSIQFEGTARASNSVLLTPGWNIVAGLGDWSSASALIAAAAEQGIEIRQVRDEDEDRTHTAGDSVETDFALDPTRAYRIWVCGAGGFWVP